MTITIELPPDVEATALRRADRDGLPLSQYLVALVQDGLQRQVERSQPRRLTRRETELLQAINQGAPPEVRQRFAELYARRHELAAAEHAELLRLSDELELLNATRLEKLLALARLRKTTLRAVMDDLGLTPPPL